MKFIRLMITIYALLTLLSLEPTEVEQDKDLLLEYEEDEIDYLFEKLENE